MNSDNYQEIKKIFNAAIDLAPAERSGFLHENCGDDKDLLKRMGLPE
jgi:hypothetical protein